MTNITHQYAGDARVPFSFGGAGQGRVTVEVEWTKAQLEDTNTIAYVWKAAKECIVSNFALKSEDNDSHATPTLEFEVGIDYAGTTTDDPDEFIDGAASTIGEAGGVNQTNVVDESTAVGTLLNAGDKITIKVLTAAATGVAGGKTWLTFDVAHSR